MPTELAVSSRFGGFKPETDHLLRTQNVESSPVLEGMKKAWVDCKDLTHGLWEIRHHSTLDRIKNLEYPAIDVETFSIALAEFQDEKKFSDRAGLFLSALINNCKDDGFVIHTSHLAEPIDGLGYHNAKSITVDGNAGDNLGTEMEGGTIFVNGNAGRWVGARMEDGTVTIGGYACDGIGYAMKGGDIIVKMGARDFVGERMKGGTIIVMGNAGSLVGKGMEGGEIHLNGDYVSISDNFVGDKIFHKKKLIAGK